MSFLLLLSFIYLIFFYKSFWRFILKNYFHCLFPFFIQLRTQLHILTQKFRCVVVTLIICFLNKFSSKQRFFITFLKLKLKFVIIEAFLIFYFDIRFLHLFKVRLSFIPLFLTSIILKQNSYQNAWHLFVFFFPFSLYSF